MPQRTIVKKCGLFATALALTAAGLLTNPAVANAADRFAAIVYSFRDGAWGWAQQARSSTEAVKIATSYCLQAGGPNTVCNSQLTPPANLCVSLITWAGPGYSGGEGITESAAEDDAFFRYSQTGDIGSPKVLVSVCPGLVNQEPRGRGGVSPPWVAPPALSNTAPNSCIQGYVPRLARPSDMVCVTPAVAERIKQENANPAAHKDPNGAYGPESCEQGFVWREGFDGDTICVTPDIRAQTLADNAAAASRKVN